DIPATLESAVEVEGLEFHAHGVFEEQPIKGVKFYYLRHILHDWMDEDSIRTLKAIVPAMGTKSRVVIDEIVLHDEKMHRTTNLCVVDFTMMASLGGVERTMTAWTHLLYKSSRYTDTTLR
ncbi:S-adenosyl-L-methionine-dependent methyltransferase, partial [Bimuria novae-zelandiae CBS 107.79]